MLRPYLKIWEWELIFGRAVKTISSPGVHSPCSKTTPNKGNSFEARLLFMDGPLHS